MDDQVQAIIARAIAQAAQYVLLGKTESAISLCKQVLALAPDHTVAPQLLETALRFSGSTSGDLAEGFLNLASDNHGLAVLPYNLNWMISDRRPISAFLADNPIILADIGARGGALNELAGLQSGITYLGFDADTEECQRLNANPPEGFAGWRIFPWYVGDTNGPVEFHLYTARSLSSRYKPNRRFSKHYSTEMNIERSITVNGITLDKVIADGQLAYPDFLKLDTQGTELEVLMGARDCVAHALMIEVEVEFTPTYEGQALYHDIAKYLYERGFELLYLNRAFQNRLSYSGPARGQVTFGDALFGRRDDALDDFTAAALSKYVVLLINYGHRDLAFDIWSSSAAVRALIPGVTEWFEPWADDGIRLASLDMDRRICRSLHRRRTNQLRVDGDRNWPIR